MTSIPRALLGLLLCTALASPSLASLSEGKAKGDKHEKYEKHEKHEKHQGKQHHKQNKKHHHGGRADQELVVVQLNTTDARRIALSHQVTGYDALPPGIRKNLARGKPLPPGIAKRSVPAPVLAQLPTYPGYEWQVAGSDLVLVSVATSVIAQVLSGVFF